MQTLEKIPDFLSAASDMAARVRKFDWTKTSLGKTDSWSQSLKVALSICLNSNFPIAIYWGKELILFYNDAWSSIPGEKHPWALGQPAKKVWPEIWNDIEPQFQKAFNGIPGGSKDALLPMQRHGYTEECYFDFTFTPVFGEGGNVDGIFNAVIETTYRVINERRTSFLQKLSNKIGSSASFNDLVEQTISCLKTNPFDIPFSFIYSSSQQEKSQLVASTEENHESILLKQNWPTDELYKKVQPVLISDINDYLYEVPAGSWPEPPKEALLVPIKANDGSINGYIVFGISSRRKFDKEYLSFFEAIASSVSTTMNTIQSLEEERKRAEALAEIDKAKTLFFTNISHEFRTPLTLMLGPIEEALKDKNTIPNNLRRMDVAHRNALRLLRLVNTLLDFSRIESGRQKANFVLTDIVSFTQNLVSNFRSVTEKAGLQLKVQTDNSIPPVYIDREMWEKIVFNLLSNAFKYTLKGSIEVKLSNENDHFVLRVKDTGVGIPQNELPHMFERFHRVQNVTGRTFEGTGIGLSLTKELVQLHGGTIGVESTQGEGTTFIITIPSGKDHLPASQIKSTDKDFEGVISDMYIEEAASILESTSAKNTINNTHYNNQPVDNLPLVMIVDDNADMREHIEFLLTSKFNTLSASNGAEALEKIKVVKPDIVLSDVMMPVMDGIELLKSIKNNKDTEQIPVILLTARAGEESKIEGWQTGADDYLVKPFSSKELVARIEAQIKIKQRRDDALQSVYNLFNEVPFAVAVLKSEDLVIEFINNYNLDIWQCKKEEVLGKPLFEARPDLRASVEAIHAEIYRTGKRFTANEIPVELNVNGIIQTRYFNAIIDPMLNEEGKIIGQLATSIDITEQVMARKKIEESETRFRFLFDSNVLPMAFWNINGTVYDANDAFLDLLAYTQQEMHEGKLNWKKFTLPEDAALHEKKVQQAVQGKPVSPYETKYVNKKGESFTALVGYAMLSGSKEKGIAFLQDISKIKEVENALRESEERFRSTFTNAAIGVAIINDEGKFLQVNDAYEKLVGYTQEELMQKTFIDISHPDYHKEHRRQMNELKEGKFSSLHYEKRYIKKDGNIVWAQISVSTVKDDGRFKNFVVLAEDITAAKQLRDELKESENRFRTLAETLPQMVWVADSKGENEYYSHHWIEYSGIANPHEAWASMIHPDDKTASTKSYRQAIASGTSFQHEVRLKNKHGEYRWHRSIAEPVKDASGKIAKWVGAMIDIHDQKTFAEKLEKEVAQRTEELVKANKELEAFNYIASHDLQEPLRKIQTFINLIEKQQDDDKLTEKYFGKIRSSAQRMSELIQSILSYSRLSDNDHEYVPTDLNRIVIDVKNDFELLIKEKNAVIKSDHLPVIKANTLQMHQLFSNLIGNSLKFSKDHPQITINSKIVTADEIPVAKKADSKQNFVQLTFSDNGIGFEPEFKQQIFQLFQRLHGKEEYSGTGIGLSIVKKIVDRHHGFVNAESLPGKGATFNVWLPLS